MSTPRKSLPDHPFDRHAFLFSLLFAGSLALGGCGAVDPSDDESGAVVQSQSAISNCPPEGCEPPPAPPPPVPPPPNLKTVAIPTAFISNQLNAGLANTKVQVTHTTGDPLVFQAFRPGNCHDDTAAIDECIEELCDELIGKARGQCVTACRAQHQICTPVCGAHSAMSFIQWGPAAKALSQLKHPETCSPATCPACPVATPVPSLHDDVLSIAPYRKSVDLGSIHLFTIVCSINRWQFLAQNNLIVVAASTGLTLRLPGTTASPAIVCDNGPDLSVSGPGIALTFHPSVTNGVLKVSAEGGLNGSFSTGTPIDWLVDFDAAIKNNVHDQLAGTLNTGTKPAQYVDMFRGLIDLFLLQQGRPAIVTLQSVVPTASGLTVKYF